MGDGAWSAGGYEVDYEWQYETDLWGGKYKINEMSEWHLKRAIGIAQSAAESATFSGDAEKWQEWVDTLQHELWWGLPARKKKEAAKKAAEPKVEQKPKTAPRGKKLTLVCFCGCEYDARVADLKRGWARTCSKHCAGVKRTTRKPDAKGVDGKSIKEMLKELNNV